MLSRVTYPTTAEELFFEWAGKWAAAHGYRPVDREVDLAWYCYDEEEE